MKVVACVFAILSGIFGLFGGTVQSIFGAGISILSKNDETMNNGISVFYLSWLLIILGGLSLRFPKQSGVGLIIISIVSFSLGNIFSAPFAFIAGIFDLLAESPKKNIQRNEVIESQIKDKGTDYKDKTSVSGEEVLDKASLLNQLSQLHDLKEKKVITDELYERERQNILAQFQNLKQLNSELATETINEERIEEAVKIQKDYDPEYEELFGKKS